MSVNVLEQKVISMSQLVSSQVEIVCDSILGALPKDRLLRIFYLDNLVDLEENQMVDKVGNALGLIGAKNESDRRALFAILRMSHQLERIGDCCESIARQLLSMSLELPNSVPVDLVPMTQLAQQMYSQVQLAISTKDLNLCEKVMATDQLIDQHLDSVTLDCLSLMKDGNHQQYLSIILMASKMERLSDECVNIAEEIIYAVSGESRRHRQRDRLSILFVCQGNGVRSIMAESVLSVLGSQFFVTSSAGVTPSRVRSETLEVLSEHGYAVDGLHSKGLQNISWEEAQIVVYMSEKIKAQVPRPPFRVLQFCWDIPEPEGLAVYQHDPKEAYAQVLQLIERKTRQLISAVG